jgi:bifunctional UDP-N-acetylglucosamine pyrophosphorylase/glucosamine-1-phosphate N-acetyltransferase
MDICAVIMAAGEGKRMHSSHAKVVHEAAGKPLICWVHDALVQAGAREQVYIVGHRQEEVRVVLGEDVAYVLQERQLGTGHAVMQAGPFLEGRGGCVLVLCGDAPLIKPETLQSVLRRFEHERPAAIVIYARTDDPTGYGRIVRNPDGSVRAIVEQRDADPDQLQICEINASMYCFDTARLLSALGKIGCQNRQQEYYLTDTIGILIDEGCRVIAHETDTSEILGVNDRIQLQQAADILNQRIVYRHMRQGVSIQSPRETWIDDTVTIGPDTVLLPGCMLSGQTHIGREARIGPCVELLDVSVGDRARLSHVAAERCTIGAEAEVGPYVALTPGSTVAAHCRLTAGQRYD